MFSKGRVDPMDTAIFRKYIVNSAVIIVISLLLEIFVFNFSSYVTDKGEEIVVASDVALSSAGADEDYIFETDTVSLEKSLKSVFVDMDTEGGGVSNVSVIMTDEGDKYEYATPEYAVCSGVKRSGYRGVYPFGRAYTARVRIRIPKDTLAHINTVSLNAHKPFDFKGIRFLTVAVILLITYFICTDSVFHRIFYDPSKRWQRIVIATVALMLMVFGSLIVKSDKLLLSNPWPHHLQYQELARSLEKGSVVLNEHEVAPGLLSAENPYDTIALQVENIPYSMDYAYYDGHYYAYFGIVPELLLFYPYHMLTGGNLPNYMAIYAFYLLFVAGVFVCIHGLIRKCSLKVPFVFYLLVCIGTVMGANFVYLLMRPDIYNIPIFGAVAFSFAGIGLWLLADYTMSHRLQRTFLVLGSLCMALVVGCRPQLALLSFASIIIFMWKRDGEGRIIFAKDRAKETLCFIMPYVIVAIPVCMYNYARFGSIFDFGAAYSLTTNDMTHRGFSVSRLVRSLYYYLFQPPVINADYPFMDTAMIRGNYMGKFLFEHTYGGIMVANTFMFSVWIMLVAGFKKADKRIRALIGFMLAAGLVIAGFDANAAGVIYRYTCDFAPAFFIAAATCWLILLDKRSEDGSALIKARVAHICILLALIYSFLTFISSGSLLNLEKDNVDLFYRIADYFRF